MNPFEILGIVPSFELDQSELASRQRRLSQALHPDRFVGRPSGERRAALGKAIEVNEAHRTLKNPLTRASSLLEVLGLQIPEGEAPQASPELLMQTMERREALREAGRSRNASEIESLSAAVRGEEQALLSQLAGEFSAAIAQGAGPQSPTARQIHQKLGHLRYLRRFLDEADALLDELL